MSTMRYRADVSKRFSVAISKRFQKEIPYFILTSKFELPVSEMAAIALNTVLVLN